jgi:predicted signal transduction protein with EAL and GGDEF domain
MKKINLTIAVVVICILINISCGNPKPKETEITSQPSIDLIEPKEQDVQNSNNIVAEENNHTNESLKNNQDQEKQFRSDLESLRRKETEVTLGYMNLKFDYNIAVSMMNEIYMVRINAWLDKLNIEDSQRETH